MHIFKNAAAVIAATTLALGTLNPALAVINEGGSIKAPGFVGVKVYGGPGNINGWAGEMGSFDIGGHRVWCIEKEAEYPTQLSGARTITDNPLAAYVLSQYGSTTDDITAAAVYYILGQDAGLQIGDSAKQRETLQHSENRAAIEAKRQQILTEAAANQGPYTLATNVEMSPGGQTGSASVRGKVNGSPITVTLSGTASFTDGTQTKTVTLSNGVWTAPVVATGDGVVRIAARTTETMPASAFTLYGNGNAQSVVVAGPAGEPLTAPETSDNTRVQMEPVIETTSSANTDKLRVGDTVTDTVTVSKGKPGTTIRVQTRLYGPVTTKPEQSPSAPTGTPLLHDGHVDIKLDANGNGTVTTAPVKIEKSGWYSYDTDWAGDDDNSAVDHGYGVPSETGRITTWTPEATTRTSDQLVTGPDALTDTVVVSGGKPGAAFTGSANLYGPFDTDPSASGGIDLTDAPTVGTVEFAGTYDADGKAEVTTPPVNISEPGFYVWAETIDAVPGVSERWQQITAMATETSVNMQPTIHTMVNDQMVLPGHTISDRVELAGLVNAVGGKPVTNIVTGSLYGPVAPVEGSCKLVDWKGAPVAATLPSTTVDAAPDGTARLDGYGAHVVTEPGCYTYAETLTSTVEGDDTPVVVEHEPGHEAQTTVALTPTVETEISAPMVKPGEPVNDTIHVSDTGNTPWTVKATLWQTQAPSCTALTHDDWVRAVEAGEAKSISEQTLEGTGDDTVTTKPVSVEQTGCLTWQTTATFENSTVAVESQFGIPSESGTVLLPRVETVANTSSSQAGATIHDTIKVSGMYGHEGVLTGHVLGPVESADGKCEGVDWTRAPKLGGIEPVRIDGDGEYTSSSIKTTTAGCYTFVETLTVGDIEVFMEAGIPSETVYLTPSAGVDSDGAGSDSTGTGSITAGEPMSGGWNLGLVAAGLVMLAGAGGVGYRVVRRV